MHLSCCRFRTRLWIVESVPTFAPHWMSLQMIEVY